MATIGGGYAVANAIAFGMPDVQTQNFYAQRLNNLVSMGATAGFTQSFLDSAVNVVASLNVNNIIDKATAVINKIKGFFRPNVISQLRTLEDFQVAGSVMQNLLMVEPSIRARYQEQRLNGYRDSYVDPFPNLKTEQHPDYRDVMTGIVQSDSEGQTFTMQYFHNRTPGDDSEQYKHTSTQKFGVVDSWATLREFMAAGGKDPTDQWNGDL